MKRNPSRHPATPDCTPSGRCEAMATDGDPHLRCACARSGTTDAALCRSAAETDGERQRGGPAGIRTQNQGIHSAPPFPAGVDYLFTLACL